MFKPNQWVIDSLTGQQFKIKRIKHLHDYTNLEFQTYYLLTSNCPVKLDDPQLFNRWRLECQLQPLPTIHQPQGTTP